MEVLIELSLLQGRQGERFRKASDGAGWQESVAGTFEKNVEPGSLGIFSIPCAKRDGFVGALSRGVILPETAILSEKAILEGYEDPVFCPEGTTLIAGELLQRPGESETELFARILSDWEWWMDLRASSNELAISWGGAPNRDLLNLLNRLDAGFLNQSPQHALAAGKIARLVGFHPATSLLAASAGIPMLGFEENQPETRLLTTWALGTEVFWASLESDNRPLSR